MRTVWTIEFIKCLAGAICIGQSHSGGVHVKKVKKVKLN